MMNDLLSNAMERIKMAAERPKAIMHCEKHGDVEVGYFYHPIKKEDVLQRCELCVKDDELNAYKETQEKSKAFRIERALGSAAIPKRFKDRTLDNYEPHCEGAKSSLNKAKKYADDFQSHLKSGGGLVIVGSVGTGKTHLAVGIANAVINAGYTAHFCTVLAAIRRVKDTWTKDAEQTETEAIKSFMYPDLLILDEVGVQFGSDTEKLILFEILNNRYEEMLPTILLSNLSVDGLKEQLGERVVDRMRESGAGVISCNWPSYRINV